MNPLSPTGERERVRGPLDTAATCAPSPPPSPIEGEGEEGKRDAWTADGARGKPRRGGGLAARPSAGKRPGRRAGTPRQPSGPVGFAPYFAAEIGVNGGQR